MSSSGVVSSKVAQTHHGVGKQLSGYHSGSPVLSRRHHIENCANVLGASGTGRTTFVNTLVEYPLLQHRAQQLLRDPENPRSEVDATAAQHAAAEAHVERQIQIKSYQVELEEDGARIALEVVDTPGFGEGIDNESKYVLRWGSQTDNQLPGDCQLPRASVR